MCIQSRTFAWCFSLLLIGLLGCSDHQPVMVQGIEVLAAKPDGLGPVKVEATEPPYGQQTERLFVRVLGSGFDDGSVATWLKDGDPVGVTTFTTDFVSEAELVADIEIDEAARVGLWDVEVMTVRGKKGIGIESFEVKEKTPPGQVEFDAYTAIDLGALGHRKGISRAHDLSDELLGGGVVIVGESSVSSRDDEMPVTWVVNGGVVDGPTTLPLLPGEFFAGRSFRVSDDGRFITGWAFRTETRPGGVPYYNAVRWLDGAWDGAFQPYSDVAAPDLHLTITFGFGVNNFGDVVGCSGSDLWSRLDQNEDGLWDFEGHRLAMVWDGATGEETLLLSPLGGDSYGVAINNQGYSAGRAEVSRFGYVDPVVHAVLWLPDGTPCDLDPEGLDSRAMEITDISSDGSTLVSGSIDSRATVWRVEPNSCNVLARWTMDEQSLAAGVRDLGLGGWEAAASGQVITPGTEHPLVWGFGLMGSTISHLADAGAARWMNGSGWIVGWVPVKDTNHGFLWIPKK